MSCPDGRAGWAGLTGDVPTGPSASMLAGDVLRTRRAARPLVRVASGTRRCRSSVLFEVGDNVASTRVVEV